MIFRLLFTVSIAAHLVAQPLTIESGRITGKGLGDVDEWLGIPYAAPPVGTLRWAPPQPPASWHGVRAMDHYGDVCMQPRRGGWAAQPAPMSEDCLSLNVWAPKGLSKAPVMVWIHGGAFIEGSGALPLYDGVDLARKGVVVVTINYRLGDFGFFAHPELTKEAGAESGANFGFQDQIAALRWVQRNIAAFGGDPRAVTVFGESAGGSSVNYLMISPKARGLFARAIAESGGGQWNTRSLAQMEQEGERRATDWGATTLAEMRALPAETIEAAAHRPALGALGPVIDGKFVLEKLTQAFAEGKQAAVPFLLGANSFEASLMRMFGISSESILGRIPGNGALLRQFYGDDPEKEALGLFTDSAFLAPARYLAAQMANVKQPAYLYFFSYTLERRRAQDSGTIHGGEIPFVFDHFLTLDRFATAGDRKMADAVSSAWVQFAKTGNPNRTGLPEWPAYTPSSDELLEWGDPIAVRPHFRAQQLDLETALTITRGK